MKRRYWVFEEHRKIMMISCELFACCLLILYKLNSNFKKIFKNGNILVV